MHLMVVVSDSVQAILDKGEYTPEYYNPGNYFRKVSLVLLREEPVTSEQMQFTVGDAQLVIYRIRGKSMIPRRLRRGLDAYPWVTEAVGVARKDRPDLVRIYGHHWSTALVGTAIRRELGVPLVVSIHTHPDDSWRKCLHWSKTPVMRAFAELHRFPERMVLKAADAVAVVYKSVEEYAHRMGARRVEVLYNIINPVALSQKQGYALHDPPRLVCVGRQVEWKNPENIIRALPLLTRPVHLTLVGNGERHDSLQRLVAAKGLQEQVTFHSAISNNELCKLMGEFDLFVGHSDYSEIPKAVMEPLLTGLPVIHNRRRASPVPELDGDWVWQVDGTIAGYASAIDTLLSDHDARERLGRRGFKFAWTTFGPDRSEEKHTQLFEELIRNGKVSST